MTFGIVFIIFAAIVAVVTYELNTLPIYTTPAPASFIRLSIITSMMPYIVSAAVSFIVAFMTAKASKTTYEETIEQSKQKADPEKEVEKERQTA